MSPVWIIAKRELAAFFDSLAAYILLIAFLGFSGFFTWIYGSDIFQRKNAQVLLSYCLPKLSAPRRWYGGSF